MKTVYRILTPIFALCVFPVMYFLPLLRAMVSSGLAAALTGSTDGTKKNLLTSLLGIGEYTSIKDIVNISKGDSPVIETLKSLWNSLGEETKTKLTDEFSSVKFLIAAAVFFAIVLLIALLTAILGAALKKHTVPFVLSVGGIVSAVIMNTCFNAFAKPFVTNAINLSSLFGSSNETLGLLLGKAVSVDYLQLSIAYTVTVFIFVIIAIFSLCAIVEEKYSKD